MQKIVVAEQGFAKSRDECFVVLHNCEIEVLESCGIRIWFWCYFTLQPAVVRIREMQKFREWKKNQEKRSIDLHPAKERLELLNDSFVRSDTGV